MDKKEYNYKVKDVILGNNVYRFDGDAWFYLYEVLAVEDKMRFGKPNQLLTVRIRTTGGIVTDEKTIRWADQLF